MREITEEKKKREGGIEITRAIEIIGGKEREKDRAKEREIESN